LNSPRRLGPESPGPARAKALFILPLLTRIIAQIDADAPVRRM